MAIDRSAVSRALAKALAYKQCGKDAEAARWAAHLVRLLDAAEILDPDAPASPEDAMRSKRYEPNGDFYDAEGNPPRWITAAERRRSTPGAS